MAKIVDEMPGRNRASKYQWDDWFNGEVWLLVGGEDGDFTSSVEGFRSSAHNAAKRMGCTINTVVKDDGVYLQAIWPDEELELDDIVDDDPVVEETTKK